MIAIELHKSGTTRLTLCIGQYALKLPRGLRGCVANYGERIEWNRATPERRPNLCPLLFGAPLGVINIMRRAKPLTSDQHIYLKANRGLPDWVYTGGPECPFEYHKPSD